RDSEAYRQLAQRLAQRGPFFLKRMRVLRDGDGAFAADGAHRYLPATAMSFARLYLEEYAHSAPLRASELLTVWQRCGLAPSGVERCRPGLRAAEALVVGDRPPPLDDWLSKPAAPIDVHHAPAPEPAENEEDKGDAGGA